MNAAQVIRMLRYRWKLAFLVLIIVFVAVFGTMYFFTDKASDSGNAQKVEVPLEIGSPHEVEVPQVEISYKITTIFACESIEANEIVPISNGVRIDVSVYHAVLRQIIADMDISSIADVPSGSTAASSLDKSAIILTVSSSDIAAAELLTDNITKAFYDHKFPVSEVYHSSPIKLISIPDIMPEQSLETGGKRDAIIQLAYNALISLTAAILCSLFAVIAREKCDKTIRSIYSLKHACDVSVMPCISEKPTASEFFSLADSFKHCDAVILAGVKGKIKVFDLACQLATSVARDDFPVAIINLTDDGEKTVTSTIDVIDKWKASPASFFRSESFQAEAEKLRSKYKLILFAVPTMAKTAHAISLAELAKVIFMVNFGKDTNEDLCAAMGIFKGNKDALLGASIISYIPNEEYIFGETDFETI